MTTIVIVILFILQLLSFYFIIILNTKLAKFKDLEKKQERLMREMDDAISLYLTEMKDENNRLISELQLVEKPQVNEHIKKAEEQKLESVIDERSSKEIKLPDYEAESRVFVPKNAVANAYNRQQQLSNHTAKQSSTVTRQNSTIQEKPQGSTFEEQVVQLSKQGKTVDEIAKQLQKGKTEIELLLKFHS